MKTLGYPAAPSEDPDRPARPPARPIDRARTLELRKRKREIRTRTGNVGKILSITRLLAAPITIAWDIPEALPIGARLSLTGLEGSGKSTMLRQIAFLASVGINPFTMQDMPQRRGGEPRGGEIALIEEIAATDLDLIALVNGGKMPKDPFSMVTQVIHVARLIRDHDMMGRAMI